MAIRAKQMLTAVVVLLVLASGLLAVQGQEYSWQEPHAKVLPTGDLEWAPEQFEYVAGDDVRYIDFEGGDDSADGASPDSAWKHHPWDANATGNARDGGGDTFVFKRGVVYRGHLVGKAEGTPQKPIRFTSKPGWGEGEAIMTGSMAIAGGWQEVTEANAPEGMPEPTKVYKLDYPVAERPWTLWQVGEEVTRLKLARTPNWNVSDPYDVKSEWFQWKHRGRTGNRRHEGKRLAFGKDEEILTFPEGALEGAFVYTEWGPVMGTPVAREVEDYVPDENTLYYRGFWGGGLEQGSGGKRWYLENSPYFLDEAGEWWFDEDAGENGALYLRLPGDANPNEARLEAGRLVRLIDLETGSENIEITGLGFRYMNVGNPAVRPFPDESQANVLRLMGSGKNIRISHCTARHINRLCRMRATGEDDLVTDVFITDNDISDTDRGVILLSNGKRWRQKTGPKGILGNVKIMRNRLERIGKRPLRGEHGHAIRVNYPETAELAGNILDRIYGAGLFVFGGKSSGYLGDEKFCRILMHHNKVIDPMLNTNDWGGIESWQGGPIYVFNNVSGNPGGYWHWAKTHFGFAYYLDGSFKNYHFNNIAWGTSTEPPHPNSAAFQEIHSFQNTFFNNSSFRFRTGSRRQRPDAGRDIFIGNVWEDIGKLYFRHGKPAGSVAEANQAHAGEEGETFDYATMGYAGNIFAGSPDTFGVFEDNGMPHPTLESMQEALKERGTRAWQLGKDTAVSPYMDAEGHDFRPARGSAAVDQGHKVFVPWALCGVVGEWPFTRNNEDPTRIIDEHWYMTPAHAARGTYHAVPMHPLKGVNIGPENYTQGPLEDWVDGAMTFDGESEYAMLDIDAQYEVEDAGRQTITPEEGAQWVSLDVPEKITPGKKFQAKVTLAEPVPDGMVNVQLHWRQSRGWGGFIDEGTEAQEIDGKGPYTFEFMPEERARLGAYVIIAYIGPDGEWGNKTKSLFANVERADGVLVAPEDRRTPDIDKSDLLIEAYFKTEPDASPGVLLEKVEDAGYMLLVNASGEISFGVSRRGSHGFAVEGKTPVNDGEWHHVVAELDREAGALTLYVDGREDAGNEDLPGLADVSLANDSHLYVAGSPDGPNLACTVDFLRIATGSLADAHTTIEELYAWQFDGPQHRDFTGREPVGRRDAGAVEQQ